MARQDALNLLEQRLIVQRDALQGKISDDLGLAFRQDDGANDLGETAHLIEQAELHTQLAALESRELGQIEHALERMRDGQYGTCERCGQTIPVARLQALPFSSHCIECQRHLERNPNADQYQANWAGAMDYERRAAGESEVTLSDWEDE